MLPRLDIQIGIVAAVLITASALPAVAQHDGDLAVGRSATDQLKLKPYDAEHPCFDPEVGVGILTEVADSYRSVDPGFDANFDADPDLDFYQLEPGAEIYLVAYEDMDPAFHVEYQGQRIDFTGDDIALGSSALHRHVRFIVDQTDPDFDPLRTLWTGTFLLLDDGTTGYADSAPFTLRFSIVECEAGDVDGDGVVSFDDIAPFVSILGDPQEATLEERCAADANRDGYVTFDDIAPFVALLG